LKGKGNSFFVLCQKRKSLLEKNWVLQAFSKNSWDSQGILDEETWKAEKWGELRFLFVPPFML
jgi:hypothetical protein